MPPKGLHVASNPRLNVFRDCSKLVKTPNGLDRRRYISAYGYTQAKALVYSKYGEPSDVLRLHTHSISPSHSTQLTLRLLAAPLNPADINQLQGTYPTRPAFTSTLGTPQPSAVGGNEGVAEVLSTGGSVKTVGKGDWVVMKHTGAGTWRTHMQTDESSVVKIEDRSGVTEVQVGTVSVNPCTAWRLLRGFGGLREGDWWVQNGANSGVGRAAIQFGRLWGFKSINVVRDRPGVEGLREELRELGADVVVMEEELMERGFGDRVKGWTNGGRVKVKLGLNCVGGKNATAIAKVLDEDACLVTYGAMAKQPLQLPTGLLIFKNIRFEGFWVSRWSERYPEEKRRTVEDILQLTREGKFRDTPVQEVKWNWDTKEEVLKEAVQGTLEGFRKGKGVFIFGDT
ncbi:MAG: mitochondrial 2-enoyl thioester reductase [Candelina submexicana]|nr:MAG: mitochondrial 2-enoyl thioester reductase [Candelina submexicana]